VIAVRELEKPTPAGDEVLVRVRASSVNPVDWHTLIGSPYLVRLQEGLRRPKSDRLGVDFAGTVEAVGSDVTGFQPGDEVFGGKTGALAEFVCVREDRGVVRKPANVTFEQAAAVPVAGLTALQGLRDKGQLEPGQNVLINGASGGVGTFAVQIAKAFGGEVTAVCSSRNAELVQSLGADHVVDYTHEDFTRSGARHDLVLDIAGGRSWTEWRRILEPRGTLVVVGGPKTNRLVGPLGRALAMRVASVFGNRRVVLFLAKFEKADLEVLRGLLESEKVIPAVDRQFALTETAAALHYLGEGHARAKVVVTV
jgi:NADPH:quinone reductase-like Zn-dependent oxidoreductase